MKMKKIVMGLVMALFAINAMADRIQWTWVTQIDMSEAQLHINGTTVGIFDYLGSANQIINSMRVKVGDYYMDPAYSDGSIDTEYSDMLIDKDACSPLLFAFYGQTEKMGDNIPLYTLVDSERKTWNVIVEVGYYDFDLDEFNTIGLSDATTWGWIYDNNHMYPLSTIAPPTTDWKPRDFYAVPEPSTAILAMLGTCLLLKRRKPAYA